MLFWFSVVFFLYIFVMINLQVVLLVQRKILENFVFYGKKMLRILYLSVGNFNFFVREFNFMVVKGLDVKGLNLIMVLLLQLMKIVFLEKDLNYI